MIKAYVGKIKHDPESLRIMEEAKRVLAFSPHPDDVEIAAGAFLASAVSRGAEVRVVVVSDDRMSVGSLDPHDDEVISLRRAEEMEAMGELEVRDVQFLNYVDSQVPEPRVIREDFIRITRSYAPDLVITLDPYLPYEAHPDHVNTGLAAMQAVLFHSLPRIVRDVRPVSQQPNLALGATLRPNVALCVDPFMEKKLRAVRAHRSQFGEDILELITAISSAVGGIVGCRFGEAFRVMRPWEIHVNLLADL
jgi:Uncharacterized proteins, LmbE homologs